MANYTISTYTASESLDDSMASSNIATPELLITPNPGYSIRANDFSIQSATQGSGSDINKWTGGTLPSTIDNVEFVDQDPDYTPGVGYSFDNTIKAIVTFASDFTVTQDSHISLDINGEAYLPEQVEVSIPINFNLLSFLTGANYNITNLASGLTWTNNNDGSALSSATQESDVNISGNVLLTPDQQQQGQVVIGEVTIDIEESDLPASEDSGNSNNGVFEEVSIEQEQDNQDPISTYDNVIPVQPGGGFHPGNVSSGGISGGNNDIDAELLSFTPKTVTVDTGEQIPDNITYELTLNTSGRFVSGQRSTFSLKAKAVSPPAVSATKVINSVSFGSSTISANGETRVMKVFGDVGAKVNIGIYTDIGTIGTEDGSESADIVSITNGEITSNTKFARGQGVFTFTATFPFSSTTKNYGVQISAGSGSSLSSSIAQGGSTNLYDYTFQQYANPTITINAITTHGGGSGSTYTSLTSQLSNKQITRVGVANALGSSLNHIKGKSDVIPINWVFTNVGGTLNFSRPLLLDNSTITNGGFEDGLTGWQVAPANTQYQHAVDSSTGFGYFQRLANSDGSSTTLDLYQDNRLQIGKQYTFTLKYSGQNRSGETFTIFAGTASEVVTIEAGGASDIKTISATLTAAGNSTFKITWSAKTVAVRMHSVSISSFTNSIPEENGGTNLRIIDAQTSINGSEVTVSGDLKVGYYGNSNVTMDVDLANLFGATS